MCPSGPQQACVASSDLVYSACVGGLGDLDSRLHLLVYTGGLAQVMGYKISLRVVSQLFHLSVNLSLYWTSHPEQFNQP